MGTYEKFDTVKLLLWYVLAGAAALVLFFGKPVGGRQSRAMLGHKLLFWLLPLLTLLGVVSALAGGDYINSFFGYIPRLNQSVILFTLWAGTVILVLAGLTRDRLEFLLKVLWFGGLAAALAAILQCLGWGIYLGPQVSVLQRAPGLLGNPDFSALFLAALAPLGLWLFGSASKRGAQIYYALSLLALMVAVIMLGSRGAWLGLALELVLSVLSAAFFRLGRKIFFASLMGAVVLAALWYGLARPSQTNLAGRSLSLSEVNVNLRFAVWDVAEQAIARHPWWGVGPGNFAVYFEQHRDKALGNQDGVFDDAHNWFLEVGSTVGLPFLLVNLILIFAALIIGAVKLWKTRDVLVLSLMLGLIGFCVMASFTPLSVGCYFLLAIFLAALFFFDAGEFKLPGKFFTVTATVLAVLGIIWGLVFFTSEVIFYRAYGLYFSGNPQKSLSLINFVIKINPTNRLYFIYRAGDLMRLNAPDAQVSAAINKIISLHPADADAYAEASNIYFLRYLDVTNNMEDLNQSISLLGQSLARDPNRAGRNVQMAVYLYTANRLQDSLGYDIFGLSLDKSSIPGWLLQARLLQMKGNRGGTLWALEQAVAAAPDNQLLNDLYEKLKSEPDISKDLVPVGYQESTLE